MKLLLLSDHLSAHTQKWAKALASKNIEIVIFSLSNDEKHNYHDYSNIRVICQRYNSIASARLFFKLQYLLTWFKLKSTIRSYKPDIVHAHYATSYGLLGALVNFHPFILSVWGSDVFSFPTTYLKRKLLSFNFSKADSILSTSIAMRDEAKKYTEKKIEITPFGIDCEKFRSMKVDSIFKKEDFVIGTVKSLEEVYGIDILISSFYELKKTSDVKNLKLFLVGKGSQRYLLEAQVKKLGLTNDVIFYGSIRQEEVPKFLNMIHVFVALSRSESFGVSVLEASACELPVVVSRVGGLPEVVLENETGIVVQSENVNEAVMAISRLVHDQNLRIGMGKAGRKRVNEMYNFSDNVEQMQSIYNSHL